jgi:serine/threonine-protein kinase HipA
MLRVWADNQTAGLLDRHRQGAAFTYGEGVPDRRAISLTMPVRTASWITELGLNPIFQMNMPEGRLRERLRLDFAKATSSFDDLDLLAIVGRQQIGRLRYSGLEETLSNDMPFQSIDEILRADQDSQLYDYLLATYAKYSGISGIQPKVLVRGEEPRTIHGATHIVKFWDEYPELAANEYFCLAAAERAGLRVPKFELSDNGRALVVSRFDLAADGSYRGFEDFCVLNDLGTTDKYDGGYETRLFRRIGQMAGLNADAGASMLRQAFEIMVLNYAVRNGDAHLKNFGVLYDDVTGAIELAPVYDVVSTTPYIPPDTAALTLDGTKRWPNAKAIARLGQVRAKLSGPEVKSTFERIADALSDTAPTLRRYFKGPKREIGDKILEAWNTGIANSLELSGRAISIPADDDGEGDDEGDGDEIMLGMSR